MRKLTEAQIIEKRRLQRNKLSLEWKQKHQAKVKKWNRNWALAQKKLKKGGKKKKPGKVPVTAMMELMKA